MNNNKFKSLLGIIVILLFITSCNRKDTVTKFRNDISNSGLYNDQNPISINKLAWKFKTNGYIFSSPVVSQGIVYVGSNDSCLYAIQANTGDLRWKYKTGGVVSSSPAVLNNQVYIVSFDGNLYALNATTGDKIWSFNGGPEKQYTNHGIHGLLPKDQMMADTWDMYLSSPTIYNGKIYFGSGNGTFYAIDALSGKEVWNFKTADVIHNAPAILDNMVIFGGWDTYLHALNADSGKEIWKFATGVDTAYHNQTGIQSSPAVYNGMVYFGCRDANLYVLDGKTGTLKWKKYNNGSWVNNTPIIKDSIVYYGTSDTHKLWALNANNGDSIFQADLCSFVFSSPVIAGNTLFIADFSGRLHSIDAKTGIKISTFSTPANLKNELNILDDKGIIKNSFFDTYFKDGPTFANNEKVMKALYSLGSFLSTPCIANGTLYIGSTDGTLYAFK